MRSPFEDIDRAFTPLEQALVWRRGKSPCMASTFSGTLLQGSIESATAGVDIDPTLADVWTVRLPRVSLAADHVCIGDTIEPACWKNGQTLTVQQTFQDTTGDFWLVCTAVQRAPNG